MAATEAREGERGDAEAKALHRASVLRPLVQTYLGRTGSLESGIRDAVWKLGVSKATVWRWIRRLAEEGGRASALIPRKRGRRSGTVMVPNDVEGIIKDHLTQYSLRRNRPSLARVVKEIRSACGERELQPPTRRTVQRRFDAMKVRDTMKTRQSAKAARLQPAPVTGKNAVERPLDDVQIDDAPADVILSTVSRATPPAGPG